MPQQDRRDIMDTGRKHGWVGIEAKSKVRMNFAAGLLHEKFFTSGYWCEDLGLWVFITAREHRRYDHGRTTRRD